jgi:HlyD family secretion protein
MSRHIKSRITFTIAAGILFSAICITVPGCGKSTDDDGPAGGKSITPTGAGVVPTVDLITVKGAEFNEYLDLPSATVMGMESTPLHSKVGGFVKVIRRMAMASRKLKDGNIQLLQITDSYDQETQRATNIEFRSFNLLTISGRTMSVHEFPDIGVAKLKQAELAGIYEKLSTNSKMLAIDIGSYVQSGTLLAELDIPEMADDLKKQQSAIKRAETVVKQKQSAIEAANSVVKLRTAEKKAAEKMSEAAKEKLNKANEKYTRIRNLGANVEGRILEEVKFEAISAKLNWESAKELVTSAGENINVSMKDIDKAVADQNVAKAIVDEAKAELSRLQTIAGYAEIRAPYSGTITRRSIDHGQFVRPAKENSGAQPLFTITQTESVRVVIDVPGRQSYKAHSGQTAWFHTIGGLPGSVIQSTITRTSATLDPTSRMMRVEIHMTNPALDSRLVRDGRKWPQANGTNSGTQKARTVVIRPGMFGTVTILKKWPKLFKVKTAALGVESGQNFVYKVVPGPDGKLLVEKHYVTVVYNDAKEVGISDGIEEGDKIVGSNVSSLSSGQEISAKSP